VIVPELHQTLRGTQLAQVLAEGLEVRGIALGGGGHRVARVDVSIDGGKSFTPAELDDHGMEKVLGNWGRMMMMIICGFPDSINIGFPK
jgi:hypothetical protein